MTEVALITGITGQDGSYLAELLLEKHYKVFGLVRRSSGNNFTRINHILDQINLIEGDITDPYSIRNAITQAEPDEIYNLASPSYAPLSWIQPITTTEDIGIAVCHLLESIRQIKADIKFYQASSSEIFGQPKESPQTENTPFNPRNPYGIAKAYAHWLTTNYRNQYNLYSCCGITYNHESPRRSQEFVFRKITRSVASLKLGLTQKVILGNINAKRDWCYAKDTVLAIWQMLQQDEADDYIIASGKSYSIQDLLECAFNYINLNWQDYVSIDPTLYRPEENLPLVGSIKKIKDKIGWQPQYSLKNLVEIMVEHDLKDITDNHL